MAPIIQFQISYTGRKADENIIDFYDVSDTLVGFQRYLALTTHFIVNNEIITQAPALKNARIFALPAEAGSWKFTVNVALLGTSLTALGSAFYAVGTADKDTPIGNLGRSIYDYVISETTGVHPDYERTIGQIVKDERKKNPYFPDLTQSKLDSLTEKCQSAIYRMHRPIVASRTAREARIKMDDGQGATTITGSINGESYDYMSYNKKDEKEVFVLGRVTSYNVNTFKGRLYMPDEGRPIPFMLADNARSKANIDAITESLSATARDKIDGASDIRCFVYRNKSRSDRLKSLIVSHVIPPQ